MRTKPKSKWTYRLRRGLLLLPFILLTIYIWPDKPAKEAEQIDTEGKTIEKSDQKNADRMAYTIESSLPTEKDGVTRYEYDVVVHGQPDMEMLQSISHEVIQEVKMNDTFQAALIHFYDYEAYIGTESPLGQAVFAPGGDWGLADTVDPGDYDEMSFGWQLREKEWDAQLSEEEVKVWQAWNTVYEQKKSDDPDVKSRVTQTISNDYDLDPETIQHIVLKQSVWAAL